MYNKTYAIVDLETTGHSSVKGDRIIQIAIVLMKDGHIIKRYNRFVNPEQNIPPFIQQLTNISNQDVINAPRFEEIADEVKNLLEDTIFVAHNTDFDLPFLQHEFSRCQIHPWEGKQLDTVELTKILFPTLPSYRLQDIADAFNIPLVSAHRADDDAEATTYVLLECMKQLEKLPEKTIEHLHTLSFLLKSDCAFLFYEVLKHKRITFSDERFPTYRGIPYRPRTHFQQTEHVHVTYPHEQLTKIAQFKRVFPQFEFRKSQFDFMDTVWEQLQNNQEVAAEVPTGIGKTMGYLLPAVIHAIHTKRPVVISTYTNYLVDKIQDSEIEKIEKMLDCTINATVLKGKDQYISLPKFHELMLISDQSYDETFTIMQILVWLTDTQTGDLSELSVSGGGQLFIDRIRKPTSSPYLDEQEADFFQYQLKQARNAHVIITNHAMLLNETERREKFFNHVSGLIVDEAHQMVHVATQLKQQVFSYTSWKYVFGQLTATGENHLFPAVLKMAKRLHFSSIQEEQIINTYEKFASAFDEVTEQLATFKLQKNPINSRSAYMLHEFPEIQSNLSNVFRYLRAYLASIEQVSQKLLVHIDQLSETERALLQDWTDWVDEATIKASEWVEIFLENHQPQIAIWVERDTRSLPGSLKVVRHPLQPETVIRGLIDQLKNDALGIVWTSGTLAVGTHKRYIPNLLGMDETTPLKIYQAPSSFYEGAKMYIIDDMPDIQQVSQSDYIEEVATAIVEATIATGGRLFVLFTSKDMLRKTYDLIIDSEQLTGYALFAQGISSGSRMKLLKSFNQFKQSVLFGTSSFWEGVDIPGDALSAIIIVRLPFMSPEEPVFKARAEQLSAQGQNAFQQYALPEAVMRMRQGFGRLIRSSNDQGAFIILDRRIETKSYGGKFIEALPKIKIEKVPLQVMVKELESWYNNRDKH